MDNTNIIHIATMSYAIIVIFVHILKFIKKLYNQQHDILEMSTNFPGCINSVQSRKSNPFLHCHFNFKSRFNVFFFFTRKTPTNHGIYKSKKC